MALTTAHLNTQHAYLAVTCHFWQNDRDLSHATVVTRDGTVGWGRGSDCGGNSIFCLILSMLIHVPSAHNIQR